MTTSSQKSLTKIFSALESRKYVENLTEAGFDLERWEFLRFNRRPLNDQQKQELEQLEGLLESCQP